VARRPHRDGHADGLLERSGGPDLERLFADDQVIPDLELRAPKGNDLRARDVADRQLRVT